MDANATLPANIPYASPAVRRFARELGADLIQVAGSGRGGRIIREDVTAFVKSIHDRCGQTGIRWPGF